MAYVVMASVVAAVCSYGLCIVMACVVMAYIVMACMRVTSARPVPYSAASQLVVSSLDPRTYRGMVLVMVHIAMARMVMASIGMAYTVMACVCLWKI